MNGFVRWPTRDTLQIEGTAANKKDTLQTKKKRCKQKRNVANKKETLQKKAAAKEKKERCKQKKEPLQIKKNAPNKEEERCKQKRKKEHIIHTHCPRRTGQSTA